MIYQADSSLREGRNGEDLVKHQDGSVMKYSRRVVHVLAAVSLFVLLAAYFIGSDSAKSAVRVVHYLATIIWAFVFIQYFIKNAKEEHGVKFTKKDTPYIVRMYLIAGVLSLIVCSIIAYLMYLAFT